MKKRQIGGVLVRSVPPALIAGGLWALGRPAGAVVVGCLALVLVAIGLLAPALSGRIDRGVARIAVSAAQVVSRGLAVLGWVTVVLPVWAISTIVAALRRRHRHPAPGWLAAAPGVARNPDGTPVGPQRSGSKDRLATNRSGARTLIAIVALTALATAGLVVAGRRLGIDTTLQANRTAPEDPTAGEDGQGLEWNGLPVDDYAHEDEPWAADYFRELNLIQVSSDFFLGTRQRDVEGRYLNVVDGHRVSYTPDDPELTVWFFGGSTMFGLGQRDDHTLPSVVARAAEADGIRIRPINWGVNGWVNWQSLEQFEQALSAGIEPPDLAVFYDGVNEWGVAQQRVELGDVRLGTVSRFPLSDEERDRVRGNPDNIGPIEWPDPRTDELSIVLAADQYRRGSLLIGALAESYDVPVTYFWQPSPFAKEPNPADDGLWERLDFDLDWLSDSTQQYLSILARSDVAAIDVTNALDGIDEPVYFDGAHTNELGARIIGQRLYEELRPQLEELGG